MQPLNNGVHVQINDTGYRQQLKHINPPLAALNIGNKRLMPSESFGYLSLRQTFGTALLSNRRY